MRKYEIYPSLIPTTTTTTCNNTPWKSSPLLFTLKSIPFCLGARKLWLRICSAMFTSYGIDKVFLSLAFLLPLNRNPIWAICLHTERTLHPTHFCSHRYLNIHRRRFRRKLYGNICGNEYLPSSISIMFCLRMQPHQKVLSDISLCVAQLFSFWPHKNRVVHRIRNHRNVLYHRLLLSWMEWVKWP